jgi:hypothetical protein
VSEGEANMTRVSAGSGRFRLSLGRELIAQRLARFLSR